MTTKRNLALLCSVFLLAGAAYAMSHAEYAGWMKGAAGANGKIRKGLDGDLAMVASAAGDLKSNFEKIKGFWEAKNASDAVEYAGNIINAAMAIETAAGAGDRDAAKAAAGGIGQNCAGCHKSHREKANDGSWVIK